MLHVGLTLKRVLKLQVVQYVIAGLLAGAIRQEQIIPVLKDATNLFSNSVKVVAVTFQGPKGLGPGYLDLFIYFL